MIERNWRNPILPSLNMEVMVERLVVQLFVDRFLFRFNPPLAALGNTQAFPILGDSPSCDPVTKILKLFSDVIISQWFGFVLHLYHGRDLLPDSEGADSLSVDLHPLVEKRRESDGYFVAV